jgi:hypothetical protein
MLLAGAFGPVLDRPGKQPPLPSEPSGTFDDGEPQPAMPVGEAVGVGVGVGVDVGVDVAVGVGDALCVGVGLAGGLEDGATVTVVVTVAVAMALTVTVAVAPTVTVCVTVALGGLGEMQTTMIPCSLCVPAFAGFAEHDALLAVSVVAWTAPTLAPTTIRTAVRAEKAARLGVMGPSSGDPTHQRRVFAAPAHQAEGSARSRCPKRPIGTDRTRPPSARDSA